MRKIVLEHDTIRKQIGTLLNQEIRLVVNRGRKRVVRYTGKLVGIYPAVFTVKVDGVRSADVLTYSYSDVVCGDVRILRRASQEVIN